MTNPTDNPAASESPESRLFGRADHRLAFLIAEALGLQPVNRIRSLEFRFHAEEISTVRVEHEIHGVDESGLPEITRVAKRLELRPIERVGWMAAPPPESVPE